MVNPTLRPEDEDDAPIEVYFGNMALDMGVGNLPKLLARYWPYLRFEGEQLSDTDYAMLVQVLILRESHELRVSNLPMKASVYTRERSKRRMRKMGILFTQRVYYPFVPGRTPRMRSQRWDMRSLFFNLEQIARKWLAGQKALEAGWNGKGTKPIYALPDDFVHEVVLPADVALDIEKCIFFPVPEHWIEQARQVIAGVNPAPDSDLRTAPNCYGTAPTAPNWSGTEARTAPNWRGHQESLLNTVVVVYGASADVQSPTIFEYFAQRRNDPNYEPSEKDRQALQKLVTDGFTHEQIIAGIDVAIARGPVRHFTHCAAIARDLARQAGDLKPEARQPEARQPEAQKPEETPAAPGEVVIANDLIPAADIYRSAGNQITDPVLARLRLMAQAADAAAQSAGSTGAQWVADALSNALGRAKPQNLLAYTDKILANWTANGRTQPAAAPSSDTNDTVPEIQIFTQATDGRKPLADQRNQVIQKIQEYGLTAEYLSFYWAEWVKRDKKRSDLTWLDWAITGAIPDQNGHQAETGLDKLVQTVLFAAQKGT